MKDSRSVDALVGAINTGNMATNGLADLAPFSIKKVIEKADSNDVLTRNAAIVTLSQMLKPINLNRLEMSVPGSRERIKQLLIKKAKDQDYNVRLASLGGLAVLPDADVVTVLIDAADNDPYESNLIKGEVESYPVREAAQKYLNRVRQNQ